MILDLLDRANASVNDPTVPLGEALISLSEGFMTPSGEVVGEMTREVASLTCIKIASETVAMLPVEVRRTVSNGKSERVNDRVGRALQIQASRNMTGYHLREAMTWDLLSWGNAYALRRETNGGLLGALDYIPASNVLVERAANGGKKFTVRDGALGSRPGKLVEVPASQMFHLMWLTRDGIRGISPIRMMDTEIGLSMAQQAFAALFFGQGSAVSAWIKRKDRMSPEAQEKLRQGILRSHGGGRRAHRIGVLDEDMDIVSTQANLADLQLIEERGYSIARIAAFYGMTPDRLNIFEKAATFASLDATETRHVKSAIQPVVERWESTADVQLLNRGGDWEETGGMMPEEPSEDRYLKFNLDGVLRGDPKTRAEVQAVYRRNAIVTANEIRSMEDWNESEEEHADAFYIEENMRPASLPYPDSRGGSGGGSTSGSNQPAEPDAGAVVAPLLPVATDSARRLHLRAGKATSRATKAAPDKPVTALIEAYFVSVDPAEIARELGPLAQACAMLCGSAGDGAAEEVTRAYIARGVARSSTCSFLDKDHDAEVGMAADFILQKIVGYLSKNTEKTQ